MSDIVSGFPKNLAYNLKKLDAGFSKTKVKIIPDNKKVEPNGIQRYRVIGNGLYDFRTLCLFGDASCSTDTANRNVHFPRFSSSVIENISITANNTTLCSINCYNYLYNMLMDIEGADISQYSKRQSAGEWYDPSIKYEYNTANGADNTNQALKTTLAVQNSAGTGGASADTNVPFCVNNWLGFFGSMSTPVIDLSDIGDVYINIQYAPASILFDANLTTAGTTALTDAKYNIDNMFMTIDRISFQDPLYYNLKTEKLLSPEGLSVAYYDYFYSAFASVQKSSVVSLSWNINSASLDQILVSFRHNSYTATRPLLLYGANSLSTGTNAMSFLRVLSQIDAYENTSADANAFTGTTNLGDAFNQSLYFMRSGGSFKNSTFSINSVNIDPYALTPIEVFNKVLQYTGFQNLDLGSSGLHAGCLSLYHFLKYYFVDICDLTNISGDNQFWISGLDGRGSGININYTANFDTNNTQSVFPVAFCRSTRHLRINAGRQLTLDPPPL